MNLLTLHILLLVDMSFAGFHIITYILGYIISSVNYNRYIRFAFNSVWVSTSFGEIPLMDAIFSTT